VAVLVDLFCLFVILTAGKHPLNFVGFIHLIGHFPPYGAPVLNQEPPCGGSITLVSFV